jgi:tetratricopeptide (TPR) repeat protein
MKRIMIIENYLEGTLDQAQKLEFEEMLVNDKKLPEEIKLQKEVNDAIKDDELHLFRQKVGEVIRENERKTFILTTFSRKFIKYPVAASIVLLIALSLWQVISLDSPQKLFADNYQPYAPDISTRSDYTSNDKLQLFCLLYQEGDYKQSFELLQTYLASHPDNQTASFYLSLNAIELTKYKLAISELNKIQNDATSPYNLHARWYLAMAYLKDGNTSEARKYLTFIMKDDNYYSKKASRILKKLKS